MTTMPKRFVQAYRQAPWRTQTQRGSILLIAVFLVASMLWVMLSVTVQAGAAGLEIQQLESDQEELQRQIADLRTKHAYLTSADRMATRAEEMGFEQVDLADITYMIVPGYTGRRSNLESAPITPSAAPRTLIKPIYTQSLWEWLLQGVFAIRDNEGTSAGGLSP